MNRAWTVGVVVAFALFGLAQVSPSQQTQTSTSSQPYTPAVPAASMVSGYGGWPGYSSGASTAAGSAMNGMASVISAKGDAALSASAAAVNLTQAQKNEIQNREDWTNTYLSMRATNKAYQDSVRGKQLSMEQLAKIAHDGVPKPLNSGQLNPVSGQLNWPGALHDEAFAARRAELDQIMMQQARYGSLSYADQTKVREITNTMFRDLKSQIDKIPAPDYVAARTFLNSVLYASTKSQLG